MTAGEPTKTAWLYLLRAGGFHTTREIGNALPELEYRYLHIQLNGMFRHGTLVRKPAGRWYAYGVTPACRMPKGMSLGDVVEALTGSA